MVKLYDRNNSVYLESLDYDLKIDNNRIIYIRTKNESIFRNIGHEVPHGLSIEDKKKFLYKLYLMLEKKRKDVVAEQEDNNFQ